MDKKKKRIIIIAVGVVIALIATSAYMRMIGTNNDPNYSLGENAKPLKLDTPVTVEFSHGLSKNDGIPVYSFTPRETDEYTVSITDIKTDEDVYLKLFVMDKQYTDYMSADNAASHEEITDSAKLSEDTKCYIIVEAESIGSNHSKYSGSFTLCISRTEQIDDVPEIKVGETISLTMEDDQQLSVRFAPEQTDYYQFTPRIVSKDDKAGKVYVMSITDENNIEVEQSEGASYLKEGKEYYIQIEASELNGGNAEVKLSCTKIETRKIEGFGSYKVDRPTIFKYDPEGEGFIAVYSVSQGFVIGTVYDSDGYPVASDKGSGGAISGNDKDFALVLQAEDDKTYLIYVNGTFTESDIIITEYIGDGTSLGKDDVAPLPEDAVIENTTETDDIETIGTDNAGSEEAE